MIDNGHIIPSNIGLNGAIGGECDGKWYGGTYGWSFTVVVPQTGDLAHRNRTAWGFAGFLNAFLLTGDDRYLDVWRKQREIINAERKLIRGQPMYPRMYGDRGWYGFEPEPYSENNLEIYYLSMDRRDRELVPANSWLSYLDGKNPNYPEHALRDDLSSIRDRVAAMRQDTTTPDTRLSDDPMPYNPASVNALRELMLGGIDCGKKGSVLPCRVRYFDAEARRPGVPPDIAALVEGMTADGMTLTLVNTNQLQSRTVIVQAGGYAEHHFASVSLGERTATIDAPRFSAHLAPGAGARLTATMRRYVNQPTVKLPW
jgi:hypothetical protein